MNKTFKLLMLAIPTFCMIGCGEDDGGGVSGSFVYTNDYTLEVVSGDRTYLTNFENHLSVANEAGIGELMNIKVTSYLDDTRTPGNKIYFTNQHGISLPHKDGGNAITYDANVKGGGQVSSVGIIYGSYKGAWHFFTSRNATMESYEYAYRLTYSSGVTHVSSLYDTSLVFKGNKLTLNAVGTYSEDDIKLLEFNISLSYIRG